MLNLRKVCTATKSWIDSLSPTQIRKLFPGLRVSIFLCRKNLADFLLTPPSFHVTSLSLQNTEFIGEYMKRPTAEEKSLMKSFANYWRHKLESLEVTKLTDAIMETFIESSASLKNFRCREYLQQMYPKLFELERLSFKHLDCHSQQQLFFTQMAANNNLKSFEIYGPCKPLEGLITLLDAKKDDKEFQLVVNLRYIVIPPGNVDLDLLRRFACSVSSSSSSSSISLIRITDLALSQFLEATREVEIVESLFKRVMWVEFLYFNNGDFIVDLFKRNAFPNLKRFDEDSPRDAARENEEIMEECPLPEGLEELTFRSRIFLKQRLPKFLKYLDIQGGIWSFTDLQDAICAVSDGCPLLEVFKIFWSAVDPPKDDEINSRLQNKAIFSSQSIIFETFKKSFKGSISTNSN